MSVIDSLQDLVDNGLSDKMIVPIVEDLIDADSFEDGYDMKRLALIHHRADCESEIDVNIEDMGGDDGEDFAIGASEYMVLTEAEREQRWEEMLDQYLDEDGLVTGADGPYFDREAWKRDARMDGAGPMLSPYDGAEHEVNIHGNWFWIYRTN